VSQTATDPRAAVARRAVAVLFLINAAAFANVVPRLPAIKEALELSNTSLGTAVAAMPVGALLSGPAAGWLVARFGSGPLAVATGVGMGLVIPGFALAPAWALLAGTFLVVGALDSLMDVSMNAHALRVQRGYGRSIINAMHGLWSIGAVLGGAAGALAAANRVPLEAHLAGAGGSIALLALLSRRWLLAGPDEPEEDPGDPAVTVGTPPSTGAGRRLALLGLLVVLSAAVEDAPQSWGAVLLRQELGTSVATAGLVFLAFQSAMTVGRLVGDRVVDRFGAVAVVRAGGALTLTGVGVGLAIGEPVAVVVGFALAGLGTAPLFPLVFHAAGELPGISTGHGVAAVAWMGRVGFLVTPPLVGAVGDAASVRLGLTVVPVAGLLVVLLASVLRDPSARPQR
jgi:fucose permease